MYIVKHVWTFHVMNICISPIFLHHLLSFCMRYIIFLDLSSEDFVN